MMGVADDWGELEKLAEKATESAGEFSKVTRGGAGSPIERRMADAFTDVAAALAVQAEVAKKTAAQQSETDERLQELNRLARSIMHLTNEMKYIVEDEIRDVAKDAMGECKGSVDAMRERVDGAVETLGKVGEGSVKKYEEATRKASSIVVKTATAAAACVALLGLLAGLWAVVGTAWAVRMSPEIQAWAAGSQGFIVGLVAPLVVFVLGFAIGRAR